MNEMSKSPSDDEKDHLDPERESETSLWKAPDADDNVKIICLGDSAVGKSKYVGGLGEQSQAQNRSGFLEAEPVPLFLQGHRGAWFLWVW